MLDFDSNNEKTVKTIQHLKRLNWIDQDTRALQTVFTVKSFQSLTFFTIHAVLEMPNGPMQNNLMKSSFVIQNLILHEKHGGDELMNH